ncbi:MAG: hypothetical protein AABO58_11390 [Acidobacteriota bacterium]
MFVIVAAAAAFRAAGSPTDAANVVGAMLTRWHYIALLAPLAMMILEWRRARARVQVVLFIAIILASLQALADTRIRMIRNDSPAPISSLSPQDPVRRRFGMLHGISSMLLVAQVLAAAAVVVMSDGPAAPPPARPQPD